MSTSSTPPVTAAGQRVFGSGLVLLPRVTARDQAAEHARAAAEVMELMCSGHQLLNESGLPRIFPLVQWTVVDRQDRRDPGWAVCQDTGDPSYLLRVRRSGRTIRDVNGFPQHRHTIRLVAPSRWPGRRWRALGPNITRPEHLSMQLGRLDAATVARAGTVRT